MQPKYWIAIGFTIIAVAMWYSTSLVPDASFSYFATVRVFQTVGMPFMFIPINSVAYTGLPPQKTSEGSALINVARNLGGSIGVSLANTELVQRSQFHQSRLVENLIQSSPAFQSTLHDLTQYFAQFGSPANAQGRALGYIGQLVSDQAALMAISISFIAGRFRRRACADRSLADPARWAGERPSGGGTLTFLRFAACRAAAALILGNVFGTPMKIAPWRTFRRAKRWHRSGVEAAGNRFPSIKAKKHESLIATRFCAQMSIVRWHGTILA